MPEMSGAELTRWVRTQLRTAKTPVVILSAAPEDELARITAEVGADAFVSKEAGPDALAEKLNSLCDDIVW
jgi:CheY-like chemotaxis protein